MSINTGRLKYLLQRHIAKDCTEEESEELNTLISTVNQKMLEKVLDDFYKETESLERKGSIPVDWDRMFAEIIQAPQQEQVAHREKRITFKSLLWVASVLLIFGLGAIYLKNIDFKIEYLFVSTERIEVNAPITNRSTLTLEDGTVIGLDSLNKGLLSPYADLGIAKIIDGQLNYQSEQNPNASLRYHTITNPRGSKVIDITLSDGSRVWLNAGSSLRFPTVFVGKHRFVEITGEGYFEVTHNKDKVFHVKKGNMLVQVLGTKFNVNAFDNEEGVKVTLLEGSVSVSEKGNHRLLSPNEQAIIALGNIDVIKNADLESIMAWKNGYFFFSGETIEEVMSKIARWYDVNVVYEGEANTKLFGGKINKESSLSEVMKILEISGVQYEYYKPKNDHEKVKIRIK